MRLTQVLNGAPVFHFWKHFGAGRKRRIPYFKHWRNIWRTKIANLPVEDHTLSLDKLPAGSRIMQAQDFMQAHIDMMPDEILAQRNDPVVYDHPWPYNLKLDPYENQRKAHHYTISSRFFVPAADCQVLTNTIIETDQLEAHPPIEPTNEHLEVLQRHMDWAQSGDSVLVRQPRRRSFPRIDQRPNAVYGLCKERVEHNKLNYLSNLAELILSKHYHDSGDHANLAELSSRRLLAYPHCHAPFERQKRRLNLELFIEAMSLRRDPLPQINPRPLETRNRPSVDIRPRSWRSIIEQTNVYTPNWSFTLPREAHLHTVQLASRIKRDHRDQDEMLARSIVHAFGLTSQVARLRAVQAASGERSGPAGSAVLLDPLGVDQVNAREVLEQPIVVQTIAYNDTLASFHFVRYQLNSVNFADDNPARVKNQAWHSGPISDLNQALRFCLDFNSFDATAAQRTASSAAAGQAAADGPAEGRGDQSAAG